MADPIRPKVKAAAATPVPAAVLVYVLRKLGVDVEDAPPELWLIVGGALASAAAYVKKDGLSGAWRRVVRGAGAR